MRKQVGEFEIDVWEGGYPVWIHVRQKAYGGDVELKFSHSELADLRYALDWARRAAMQALPDSRRTEAE